MEAHSCQNNSHHERIAVPDKTSEKQHVPVENQQPARIANNFKLALLCALAMGCGSADQPGKNIPQIEDPAAAANTVPRQFILSRESGQAFSDYYIAAVYPGDLRFVLRDLNNELNFSYIDTRGRDSGLDTVYSRMPVPAEIGVSISVFEKASCEPESINCTGRIPVKKVLHPGEEGIQGPSEALVY
jgi:hypothetical protein